VIDQRKCIGCHACTVACKEENRVPLGAFRTWVKYVERGTFPDTRRHFAVLRCNHCDNAPCVTICPTVALYRRPDGIVDLDGARCIGCKSCMHACPYDALYIDPTTHTAAKCHYCAHRVEVGLEPACVIVCPEQAIIAGDLDDPATTIARLVAREPVQVRKAEQRTRPKVFYVGADTAALTPRLQQPATTYLWGERSPAEVDLVRMVASVPMSETDGALSRPVYDAPHAVRPWGARVSAYLWTKSISAGALMVAALAGTPNPLARAAHRVAGADHPLAGPTDPLIAVAAPLVSLIFLVLTTALLVLDLKRPDRFHYILLKPNPRSWLVWGAWILLAFGVSGSVWLAAGLLGLPALVSVVAVPAALLGLAAAGYSAFLFGQAEGRDFWQSPLLLPHLIAAAVVAGAAALMVVGVPWSPPAAFYRDVLAIGLVAHGALVGIELLRRHRENDAARAARLLTRGGYAARLWVGVALAGTAAPLALLLIAATLRFVALDVLAAVLALAGLWLWEDLWVKAGQSVPLS
jgi:Fe-S-cluster-containing dehydrogenase component/formate-dependent nitrite reductase membrane component NrfD